MPNRRGWQLAIGSCLAEVTVGARDVFAVNHTSITEPAFAESAFSNYKIGP